MRVIKYNPKEKALKGHVEIEVPNFKQRMLYIKESGFEAGETVKLASNIDALLKLVDVAEKHIKKVDIKAGKEHIKSWGELMDSPQCDSVIQEICGIMMGGIRLGEA